MGFYTLGFMHTRMGSCKLISFLVLILMLGLVVEGVFDVVPFDANYEVRWGSSHVKLLNNHGDAELWMDKSSGAGFGSKLKYGSGFFEMRIKLPNKNTAGVVTAFYLKSNSSRHEELDFEFLGNKEGKPITLQTNVFLEGIGSREQRLFLWFDPSADFHSYKILWNPYHIVFYVDNIPIRVYRNPRNSKVIYPRQAMNVEVSLWDGEDWATDGGQTKTDWSNAPFVAHFQDFGVAGCPLSQGCHDPRYWWNGRRFSALSRVELREMQHVRHKYMNYDYCDDANRFPTTPPECAYNK